MELESVHVSDILEVKAVPDSSVFRSLLTVSVQQRGRRDATVFMFQCEDVKVTTSCHRSCWTTWPRTEPAVLLLTGGPGGEGPDSSSGRQEEPPSVQVASSKPAELRSRQTDVAVQGQEGSHAHFMSAEPERRTSQRSPPQISVSVLKLAKLFSLTTLSK